MTQSEELEDFLRDPSPAEAAKAALLRRLDELRTSTEAMDIILVGLDLDRRLFPDTAPDEEVRRRWSAQMHIVKSTFYSISSHVRDLVENIPA